MLRHPLGLPLTARIDVNILVLPEIADHLGGHVAARRTRDGLALKDDFLEHDA